MTNTNIPPLHAAIRNHDYFEVARRIKSSFNLHQYDGDWQPIHTAVCFDDKKIVKLLLNNGASPDAKTQGGETAFDLACDCRSPYIAKLLLARGAHVSAENIRTFLSSLGHFDADALACATKLVKKMITILDHSSHLNNAYTIPVDDAGANEWFALAAEGRAWEICKRLYKHFNIDPDAEMSWGGTALQIAVFDHPKTPDDIILWLLDIGADPHLKTQSGTAISTAEEVGPDAVASLSRLQSISDAQKVAHASSSSTNGQPLTTLL